MTRYACTPTNPHTSSARHFLLGGIPKGLYQTGLEHPRRYSNQIFGAFDFWVPSDRTLIFLLHQGPQDLEDDVTAGFKLIHTYEIDDIGVNGIVKAIKARVGDGPVYLSLDIDVADPSAAPASTCRTSMLMGTC